MTPSIYINLEDDVSQIASRLKRERSEEVVLVCPKRCFLFSDSINLRLLKKQTDVLKKRVYILTMDERGQIYAKEAGFELRFLSHAGARGLSDIRVKQNQVSEIKTNLDTEADSSKNLVGLNLQAKTAEPEVLKSEVLKSNSVKFSPKVVVVDRVFPKAHETQTQKDETKIEKSKTGAKSILFFLFTTVSVFLLVIFYVLPSATITIFPKLENVNRDLEVSLSSAVFEVDSARLLLPATKISQTFEVENKFQSQGKKEVGNKAVGSVRIYNFTKLPINLKAQTTTLSIGNKSYVLTADALSVKPTLFKNSKTKEIDLESLNPEVEVQAVEGGESFNLPAGVRLEITNKIFGSKPKILYAKSDTAISGATTRFLSVISDLDVQKSREILTGQILENLQQDLKAKSLVFPEKGFALEVVSFSTDKPSGSQSPSFTAKLRATISGLAFSEANLKKIINERLIQALGIGKNFSDSKDGEKLIYSLKNSYNLGSENASLSVHYESNLIYQISVENIRESLKGKKPEEVQILLKNHPEIDHIDINLTPSWQKTFPIFQKKIQIKIN